MPCAIGPFVLASDVCTIRIPRPRSTFLDERRKIISPRSFDRVVQPRRAFKNSRIKRIFFLKNYSINNKLYPRYIRTRISKFHRKVKESEIFFFWISTERISKKKKKSLGNERDLIREDSQGFLEEWWVREKRAWTRGWKILVEDRSARPMQRDLCERGSRGLGMRSVSRSRVEAR